MEVMEVMEGTEGMLTEVMEGMEGMEGMLTEVMEVMEGTEVMLTEVMEVMEGMIIVLKGEMESKGVFLFQVEMTKSMEEMETTKFLEMVATITLPEV